MERWTPHCTVATLVYQAGKFLLVEEYDKLSTTKKLVLNQPAGHLEVNESLIEAAVRETLEETGWVVEVEAYLGLYVNTAPNGVTYHRHCFIARPITALPDATLDDGILAAHWLTLQELDAAEAAGRFRSPMVRPCINDFLAGKSYPLALIQDFR